MPHIGLWFYFEIVAELVRFTISHFAADAGSAFKKPGAE